MIKYILFLSIMSDVLFSQSPGGISGNLRGWFDAAVGVTLTSGAVSAWEDRAAIGNASQTTAGERPTQTSAAINYNTALTFDGTNDNLDLVDRMASGVTGVSAYAVAMQTGSGGDTWGSIFNGQANGPLWTGGGYGLVALNSAKTQHGFYVRDYNTRGVAFTVTNNVPTLFSGTWNGTSSNNIEAFRNGSSAGTIAYTPGSVGDNGSSWIGSGDGANTDWCFLGQIAEIIIYNTGLSSANNVRVMSYLALKYAITMAINYVNSAGTTVYSTTGTYTNNIIAISRDDGSGLIQKQSKNLDDSVRIYISSLAASNSANTGSFSSDLSHIVVGADAGRLCSTNSTSAEVPTGILRRINREWKVTNTNFSGTFNMDFRLNTCAFLTSINIADLRLIVDDDGNFASGTTTTFPSGSGGLTITYSNPLLTISGISTSMIPSGSTRFITIGSVNGNTPLPIKLISFDAVACDNNNCLTWKVAEEINLERYVLQRSEDAINFYDIQNIVPKNFSTFQKVYTYTDTNIKTDLSYYRLKSIDLDGKFEYSSIIYLNRKQKTPSFKVYPNPSTGMFEIQINRDEKEVIGVEVYNAIGVKVYANSTFNKNINLKEQPEGVYNVQVYFNNEVQSTKLFLKHN